MSVEHLCHYSGLIRARGVLLISFLCAVMISGCSKNPAESSIDSDANGFVCNKCGAKFYTRSPLFADHCPSCKSTDLRQVVGFLCYKDQHLTLVPQGPRSIACEKCGAVATGLKMPRQSEFASWGATLRQKSEVLDKK